MNSSNKNHIQIIKKAYDDTVDRYHCGINDEEILPKKFKNSARYKRYKKISETASFNSDNPEIKKFLSPMRGMNFLDIGSCANLISKKLYQWPSIYYGIDISPKLIKVTQNFVKKNNIKIGGLYVAEVAKMPFKNNFFDICAIIGVLEYFDLKYIKKSLKEICRVLKPDAKMIIDMPNLTHPDAKTMIEMEGYLGRPRYDIPSNEEFEKELKKLFSIDRIEDSKMMKVYFVKK